MQFSVLPADSEPKGHFCAHPQAPLSLNSSGAVTSLAEGLVELSPSLQRTSHPWSEGKGSEVVCGPKMP